jgi:hypothetical protein
MMIKVLKAHSMRRDFIRGEGDIKSKQARIRDYNLYFYLALLASYKKAAFIIINVCGG